MSSLRSDFYASYKVEEVHHNVEDLLDYYKGVISGHSLNINPAYQRGIVWSLEDRQRFIISLFNNTYTGVLVYALNHDDEYKYELIDGKQRLTALFDFVQGKFALANGMYFNDLCDGDKLFILNYNLLFKRISGRVHDLTIRGKVHIFLQLNSGVAVSKEHLTNIERTFLV